ncbi:MAG: hypothetical protein IPP08_12735 [Chlorobiota bacterium]|nr:MAG: hypothetical protein IPP08_12735 [Chlorobiota bacterium]
MVLKTVIHDWSDENAIKILTNCRKNLKPGGKILLVEQIIEEPHTLMSLFYDLHMQVMLVVQSVLNKSLRLCLNQQD